MRSWVAGLVLALAWGGARVACAQQYVPPPSVPAMAPPVLPVAGETDEQHGRRLLNAMLKALGGQAWLDRGTVYREGQTALFFRNQPTGAVSRFAEYTKLAAGGQPDLTRVEYITEKGMIEPGTKRDVAHVWTADNGYEITYKGVTTLPKEQVTDYLRRRDHSIEEVMTEWLKQPGVMVVSEGPGMRDRLQIDKVTVLAANNDAVTLELSQDTHLPVERLFEWRNEQFHDHDVDEEVYGDWRVIQGVATPMNTERYRNGDMVSQTFYKTVKYGVAMEPKLFNPDLKLEKH